MKTTSKIVRALFLIVVFFGYTQNTKALDLHYSCDPPWCIGFMTQATRCYYADWDYLTQDTCYDVESYFEAACTGMSNDPYNYWFALEVCDENGGHPAGQFYCSYVNEECQ